MEGDSDDQNYMQRRHGQLGMVNCRIKQTLIGIWGTCRPDSGMCGSAELVHLLETVFCTSIELNSWRERGEFATNCGQAHVGHT